MIKKFLISLFFIPVLCFSQINGVTSPSKINGISFGNIAKVNGIPMGFSITETQSSLSQIEIELKGTNGTTSYINWGDDNITTCNHNGTRVSYTHDYSETGVYDIKVYSSLNEITEFRSDANHYYFTLEDLGEYLPNLTYFYCAGSNQITGNIADLPSGLTYFLCTGSNTISGNVSGLPSGLTYFYCTGSNTISGNVSDLPSGLTYFYCTGFNTISGNVSDLPSGLTTFLCTGSNTISGNVSDLPSGLTTFLCYGSNTISGNVSDLPSGLTYFLCTGSNTISDYTSGRSWAANMIYVYLAPTAGNGLSSTELDNLLIDLAATTWTSSKILWVAGNNAARTAASDAAKTTLIGMGVTVTVNE